MKAGSFYQNYREVRLLVVHCSATRCDRHFSVEALRRSHLARGFADIGYHFYIRRSGIVTQHRRLLEVGAHVRGLNRCSIGICYEGGLDESGKTADTRPPEQKEQLRELLWKLHTLFPHALIVGHRDLPGVKKACPCFSCDEYRYLFH